MKLQVSAKTQTKWLLNTQKTQGTPEKQKK